MSQPSSRYLSHDFPAWKGLSLRELFWIVITTTPLTSLAFTIIGIFIGFPIASGCVGFIVGFLLAITLFPKSIARIKAGKPYGYVTKQATQVMVRLRLKHSPWIHYQGQWNKNKSLGNIMHTSNSSRLLRSNNPSPALRAPSPRFRGEGKMNADDLGGNHV